MATYRDAAVDLMKQLVDSGRQYSYDGGGHTWTNLETMYTYGVPVEMPLGDTDCSGAVTNVYMALGVLQKGYYDTGNMADSLCSQGFIYHPWEDSYVMRPGDLALRPKNTGMEYGHVAMCVADDFTLAEFTIPAPRICPFYDYPWTICLELPDSIGNQAWSGGSTGGSTSIAGMQTELNGKLAAFGLAGVSVSGAYDFQTQNGLVRLLQASDNYDYGCGLAVDGYIGAATAAAMDAHPVGEGGETVGNDCWTIKAMLVGNGWDLDLSYWDFDDAAKSALAGHKPYHGLPATPICDGATLRSLATAVSV